MKRKLLSLLLVITLLAITVSTGIPTILAADENLITNGDFSSYSGNTPTGWRFDLPKTNTFSYEIVEDVQIPDGPTTNAIKFTAAETHISKNDDNKYVAFDANGKDARMYFSGTETIRIEKNATYTMTFWAKTVKTHGLTCMMFEPNYVIPSFKRSVKYGVEGHNIYTYKTSAGTLRNSRPEIDHLVTVASTGSVIKSYPSSMFTSRYSGTGRDEDRAIYNYEQPLTPDFPKYEKEGEWVKIVYTFSTDNTDAHEADVAFSFRFPQVAGGEVWLADLQMNVQKDKIDGYYTPTNKTPELGAVSQNLALPQGKTVKMTAEPFGENKFDGWYNGETLISKDLEYSFTYDPENPPAYEARFKKANWGVDGSLEKLSVGKVAGVGFSSASDWSATAFKTASVGGQFFADSVNGGTSGAVSIIANKAHTGTKVAEYVGQSGYVGYKFTGLNKNTSYHFSAYAFIDSEDVNDVVNGVYVTDANSGVTKLSSGSVVYKTATDDGVRYYSNAVTECRGEWKKVTAKVNTGNSTDVILWIATPASGANLYLDNFAVARDPYKFAPTSNNYNLGFVSPVGGADAYENEDVTVTATPLDGNGFDGWYLGSNRISTSLSYTHKYDPTNTAMNNLVAKFTAGPFSIDEASFENQGYTKDQVLATHFNGYVKADGEVWADSDISVTGKWSLDAVHDGTWQSVIVDTAFGHTGNTSINMNCRLSWAGYQIDGLQPNTNYAISFYGWSFDNKADTVNGINLIRVADADQRIIVPSGASGGTVLSDTKCLGGTRSVIDLRGGWTKVVVPFKTKNSGSVKLWLNILGDATHNTHIDDIAVYESVAVTATNSLGGSITSNLPKEDLPKGSYVELTAHPMQGNTFAGWYNLKTNELISTQINYNFNATGPIDLIAKFEGDNMPPGDVLELQGMDGTFEQGTVTGWWADDPTYGNDVSWCRWEKENTLSYEGNMSLAGYCRYRSTNLTLSNLTPNTNYCFSMYVNVCGATDADNTDNYTRIGDFGIMGPAERYLDNAQDVLVHRKFLRGNAGWQRIDLYFNTGDRTEVIYSGRVLGRDGAKCYYDNIKLIQFESTEQLANGDFSAGVQNWCGDRSAANGALKVDQGKDAFQTTNIAPYTSYTVKFRAKGNGTVAAQRVDGISLNVKDYISSVSKVAVAGTDWNEYSFDVYTGVHEALNILANGGQGGIEIDDVTITRNADPTGAVLEKIDFESERFALGPNTNQNVYSIYTATDANDKNVLSGNKSLKFTYNPLLASSVFTVDEGWASYQVTQMNFKVSFNYKIADGSDGGPVKLAPEVSGTYGSDIGFEHTSKTDEWQNVTFFFTNVNNPNLKLIIANVMDATAGDFYIDDIEISIAPPMVNEENSRATYCEALYNAVENEGFEKALGNDNWKGLSSVSTAKVMSGNALKGSKYLRANAGTHYVLEVDVKPSTVYYFGASVRGTANSDGYIGVSLDKEGNRLYANREDLPASKVSNKKNTTDWNRTAFQFTSDSTGKAYVVIDVDSGYIDIDSVMMFTDEYSYRYDPNDYMVYVPYDYDNLKSSTTVINGGFGPQPYYKKAGGTVNLSANEAGADFDSTTGTPDTGDSILYPTVALVLAAVSLAVIVIIKRRKEGANADA